MAIPCNISYALKKIWSSREVLVTQANLHSFVNHGKFSIHKCYKSLRGDLGSVPWKRLTCNNLASPRSLFITWMAIQDRLATKVKLLTWHINTDGLCILCSAALETTQHLFFACPFSAQVWQHCLNILHLQLRSFVYRLSTNLCLFRKKCLLLQWLVGGSSEPRACI